jgi:hypothetical protein
MLAEVFERNVGRNTALFPPKPVRLVNFVSIQMHLLYSVICYLMQSYILLSLSFLKASSHVSANNAQRMLATNETRFNDYFVFLIYSLVMFCYFFHHHVYIICT